MTIFDVLSDKDVDELTKVEAIKRIIKNNPKIIHEVDEQMGATPLHWAVHKRLPDVAAVLLEKGVGINLTSNNRETPLHIAAMYDDSAAIIPWLVENGADIEARTREDATPLFLAASQGANTAVRLLLKSGADVIQSDSPYAPLHIAADNGHCETVTILLEHGADIEARKQENQFTPLACAAWFGYTECIKILLEHDANIEARDDGGNTPLSVAAFQDQLEAFKLLLEKGANVNARNNTLLGGDDHPGSRIIDVAQSSEQGSKVAEFLSN